MMRFTSSFGVAAAIAVLLPACVTTQSGRVDSRLVAPKSFAFLGDKAIQAAEAASVSNAPYWHERVEAAIEGDLVSKGYSKALGPKSDLVIAFHVVDQRGGKVSILDNYSGYSLSAREQAEQGASLQALLQDSVKGERHTLVIDVLDPVKREVVWREMAYTTHKLPRAAKERQKSVDRAVQNILSTFPSPGPIQ